MISSRPLLLYSLVSKSVFSESTKQDFYSALLPFFEPFLVRKTGEYFDIGEFASCAKAALHLVIPREVVELFVPRMAKLGWISRDLGNQSQVLYRVTYTIGDDVDTKFWNVESDLDTIFSELKKYCELQFPNKTIPERGPLEDEFLAFLIQSITT